MKVEDLSATPAELKPADRSLIVDAIASQIRVLRARDGIEVSDGQCRERAVAIVAALSGVLTDAWDSGYQEGLRDGAGARGGKA